MATMCSPLSRRVLLPPPSLPRQFAKDRNEYQHLGGSCNMRLATLDFARSPVTTSLPTYSPRRYLSGIGHFKQKQLGNFHAVGGVFVGRQRSTGPRELLKKRRIILWILYAVGLVGLAIWASWRHKHELAHRLEDSRCRQLPAARLPGPSDRA